MTAGPSLKRSFAYNAANLGLNILYPLAFFAYAARVLGPTGMGRVGMALAAVAGLLMLSAMPLYGAKAIARSRGDSGRLDKTFSELLILNGATMSAALVLYLVLVASVPQFRAEAPLFLACGAAILFNAANVDWLFAGMEDFRNLMLRNFVVKGATLAALFLLVRDRDDAMAFAALNAGSAALAHSWGLLASRRVARFRLGGLAPAAHLRDLGFVSGSTAASGLYTQMDASLLGALEGPHAVGVYSAAIKLSRMSSVFLASLGFTALPRLAHQAGQGAAASSSALQERALRLSLFLALPIACLLGALAPQIIALVSGPEFAASVPLLRLSAPLVLLAAAANFIGMQVLFPTGGERALLLGALAGAMGNVALNAVLIPAYGAHGCALAAVITEGTVLLAMAFQARGRLGMFRVAAPSALGYFVAAALSAVAAAWLAERLGPAWLAAPGSLLAGGILYLGALGAAGDPVARLLLRMPCTVIARKG